MISPIRDADAAHAETGNAPVISDSAALESNRFWRGRVFTRWFAS
jgi:hypothetical protein